MEWELSWQKHQMLLAEPKVVHIKCRNTFIISRLDCVGQSNSFRDLLNATQFTVEKLRLLSGVSLFSFLKWAGAELASLWSHFEPEPLNNTDLWCRIVASFVPMRPPTAAAAARVVGVYSSPSAFNPCGRWFVYDHEHFYPEYSCSLRVKVSLSKI